MADSIANQFTGLPIENLIAAPLLAAAEGQKSLAQTTASFITDVGMDKDGKTKSVTFNYEDGTQHVALDVPLLSIINIPSLCVDEIDINFDMEVSTQTASKSSTDLLDHNVAKSNDFFNVPSKLPTATHSNILSI